MKKYLLIAAAIFVYQYSSEIQSYLFPKPEFAELHDGKVILYATSWCGYCEKARQFLDKENIPFYEYDIEKSPEGHDQYRSIGGRGVPVLLINGSVIQGYSPREILKYSK